MSPRVPAKNVKFEGSQPKGLPITSILFFNPGSFIQDDCYGSGPSCRTDLSRRLGQLGAMILDSLVLAAILVFPVEELYRGESRNKHYGNIAMVAVFQNENYLSFCAQS